MTQLIEDYALLGDTGTAALVGRDGSIDWFCAPRFDSPAMFAALLGDAGHGRWLMAPADAHVTRRRRYRDGTLILETELQSQAGAVRLVDLMPVMNGARRIVRLVEGIRGRVTMRMELVIRFDYGQRVPWVTSVDGGILAVAGPDAVVLKSPIETHGEGLATGARFMVDEGMRLPFVLSWFPSHREPPPDVDAVQAVAATERWWRSWSDRCSYTGPWREAVIRSLIVLKALIYAPTGGIVAAPTTSLPEEIGGVRNWDYRYCWLRDATFVLYALMHGGYRDEAISWRDWLLRAVAGDAEHIQILYGVGGERRIIETVADWLPGYEASRPVRLGNAAVGQLQLDVFGELLELLHVARRMGITPEAAAWSLQRHLVSCIAQNWQHPDSGIWEVRGGPRRFTHSRVMAWVALDRTIRSAERYGLAGPLEEWKRLRAEIHADVCRNGWDPRRGTFVRSYGSPSLDASLLLIPLVGFLPPSDPRVRGTVEAIESDLLRDGLLRRYDPDVPDSDGVEGGEAAFLPCTFWLVDAYEQIGRHDEARALFEHLISLRNDVGLLAEEFDPTARRQLGNFPQALSHVALINSASNLAGTGWRTTSHRTERWDRRGGMDAGAPRSGISPGRSSRPWRAPARPD